MTAGGPTGAGQQALAPSLAVVVIMKSMIGAGVLALPYACGLVRLAVAIPGLIVVSALCTFGTWLLIDARLSLQQKDGQRVITEDSEETESDCSEASGSAVSAGDFGLGPVAVVAGRLFGPVGVILTGIALMGAQLGIAIAYIDVVTETTYRLLDSSVPLTYLRVVFCAGLCLISLVRGLEKLAWLSVVALLVYTAVAYALVKYGIAELSAGRVPPLAETMLPMQWSGVGRFLGTSIFSFEGVVIAQYVFDDMKLERPKSFLKVLGAANAIALLIYAFIGGFGYAIYGDCVRDVIYRNFPSTSMDVKLVEIALCIVLVLTYVLQMYPVFSLGEAMIFGVHQGDAIEDGAAEDLSSEDAEDVVVEERQSMPRHSCRRWLASTAMRWCVVIATFLAAAVVPNLSMVTDYVGAFGLGYIGFVLPGIAHMKVNDMKLTPLQWVADMSLVLVGLSAMVLTVANSGAVEDTPGFCPSHGV